MSRSKVGLLATAALLVGIFSSSSAAGSINNSMALGHTVRWDLAQVVQGTLLAGGTNKAKDRRADAFAGDVVSLTGSGDAEPGERDAAGGGTFIHGHADGSEVARGVWFVTGFVSWDPLGGTFPPIRDGIGHREEASAGVLVLNVHLISSGGVEHDAVLSINCHLPGASEEVEEGVVLTLGPISFTQNGGVTIFHVLR